MPCYETYQPKNELERKILAYNPFEDDFGDCADITFKDRMVRGRNAYKCRHCAGVIKTGEQQRYIMQKFDGNIGAWRFCYDCCLAMAKVWDGDWETLEFRSQSNKTA